MTRTRTLVLIAVSLSFFAVAGPAAAQYLERFAIDWGGGENERMGWAVAFGDFDNDGEEDLAVGSPRGIPRSGAPPSGEVFLHASGLDVGLTLHLWQGVLPLDPPEAEDLFGYALAFGDFNGDGYADLAVGVPGEGFGPNVGAGAVQVFYGNVERSPVRSRLFFQGFWAQDPNVEANDQFGQALATGDFNGDGHDDLAVGAPGENIGTAVDAGAVTVLYGGATGLDGALPRQLWSQASTGITDTPESRDRFGHSLAAADLDGDGLADLVVGVPFEDLSDRLDAGVVHVLYGSPFGLNATRSQLWHQDVPGIASDTAEPGDLFGFAVAGGDLNGDGIQDLAVGAPGDDGVRSLDLGAILVFRGSPAGVIADGNKFYNTTFVLTAGDQFGYSLASGDLDEDGVDDLVVGVPGDDGAVLISNTVQPRFDAGSLRLIYGEPGLFETPRLAPIWVEVSQNTGWWEGWLADYQEGGDRYGHTVAVGYFRGRNRQPRLAVGIPSEDKEWPWREASAPDAGAVELRWGLTHDAP